MAVFTSFIAFSWICCFYKAERQNEIRPNKNKKQKDGFVAATFSFFELSA